jgi:Ca-activated chloride channel homolog
LGITNCPSCGDRLFLQYRYYATKLIGQGGFGRTYRAIDTHNSPGKLCVIKQFTFQSNNRSTNKTAIDLFYQEAEHLKSLGDHPQIPSLIDYFDAGGKSYLVQEYIDGENLEQELSIEGRFDQGQIREILESLLPVLDGLHHRSTPVIHRDIKPANIIRRRSDGKLVLVDFGAAKLASETLLAKTGTSIGSAILSVTYGSLITMLVVPYYLKSKQFNQEENFHEMTKSIATPWLLLALIYAIDVLLASLFRY